MARRRALAWLFILITGALLCVPGINAQDQQIVVDRNVYLRDQPAGSSNKIELLAPPTSLTLLESGKTSGYYHAKDAAGHEGWVWGRNVHVAAGAAGTAHETVATTLSSDWEKPAVVASTWQGDEGDCGPDGDGQDDVSTDHRKNRADTPTIYHRVAFAALTRANLPYPDAPNHRDGNGGWSASQLAEIAPFEGEAITVEGYMFAVRLETSGSGEATNCHQHHEANTDVHIALTENFQDLEPSAVVVETTPRIRKDHPNWAAAKLQTCCKGKNVLVRISGWTMVDPFHIADVGKRRQTLWEIHPITKIEIFTNGQWHDADEGS